jgi:hypothetical protein
MPKRTGLLYTNDFESIKGWQSVTLTSYPVHSGLYSNKMDSMHVYGATFRLPFRDISAKRLKKVRISLWTYFEENSQATLVMDIDNPDNKSISWTGANMALELQQIGKNITKWQQITDTRSNYSSRSSIQEIGKWQQITQEFSLQDTMINKPDNIINIYPWNNGKKNVYVDDIVIEFIPE